MAFNNRQGNWVSFDSKTKEIFTSKERLDKLFSEGFRFEAVISQTAVIDALAFTIVFIHGSFKKVKIKDLFRLPLGEIIKRSKKYNLMDEGLIKKLEKYNEDRKKIVHHTIRGDLELDFNKMFELGQEIIIDLNKPLAKQFEKYGHKW